MPPRVAPRTPLQDRVDEDHSPRGELKLTTEGKPAPSIHWTTKVSLVALAVFVVSLSAGLGLVWISPAIGSALLGLAAGSLVTSLLMGAS